MAYLKFLNSSEVYKCKVIPQNNIVTLKFDSEMEISTAGFNLYNDETCETDIGIGAYHNFTTVYRNDETTAEYNGYQLSKDGSVYVEPEPPAPDEPTIEELKSQKISEMEIAKSQIIENGIDVELLDGTQKRFPLDNKSLLYMMGLQSMVAEGQEQIPWHTDDENEPCEFYSNYDMKTIMSTALSFIMYNETRIRDLTRYINSLTDKESVQAITYNTEIPKEFQSEVLQTMSMRMQK